MKVQAYVKELEQVEDPELRQQYTKIDNGFLLVPDGMTAEEVRPYYDKMVAPQIAGALEKERQERKNRGLELESWTKLGVTRDEAEKIIKKHRESIEKGAESNPELVKEMKDLHRQEKQAWENERKSLASELDALTIDREVDEAIIAEGGEKALQLLRPHVKQNVRRLEENGSRVVRVVKEDGKTIRVGDAEGTPMTVRGFVASLKQMDAFKPAFSVTVPPGTGTSRQTTNGVEPPDGGSVRSIKDFKSTAQKVAWINKHGRAKFEALPLE